MKKLQMVKNMAKMLILASLDSSLIRFRGDLIKSWIAAGHAVIAAAPEKTVQAYLEQMGVLYTTIPLKRVGLNTFEDIKLMTNLIKLLGNIKPDYLFAYTAKPDIYGSLAMYLYPKCRVYLMITELGSIFTDTGKNTKLIKWLMIILYRAALLPSEPDSFLLIARLLKEKGIFEYIEAARILKAKYPETVFRMIGWFFDDNPSTIGKEQVEKWKQEDRVEIYRVKQLMCAPLLQG